ncbi:MAG: family 43 glycosylhydrolase [Chitinispirillaceae bacterium]|nr:family 43 glycosylhydrolase [Chitinispirillaceae bacterium]
MNVGPGMSAIKNRFARALLFSLVVAIHYINAGITDPGNGNPLVPGFFADPFVYYDNTAFYIYSTTDGYDDNSFSYFGPFGVWYSPDFLNWSFTTLLYPADFPYDDSRLWAPSVTRGTNGKYHMYYIRGGDNCYVVSSDSALGPWSNVKNGRRLHATHVFDADVFRDYDSTCWLVFQEHIGNSFSIRLAQLAASMDTLAGPMTTLYSSGSTLSEGPTIFKRNDIYYLMFSQGSLSSSYHVVYGYSRTTITGPYTIAGTLLQSRSSDNISAPGHNSILKFGADYFIVYHRWRYPPTNSRVFRQPCADQLSFNSDGTIRTVTLTHTGIGALAAASVADSNVARGKGATASSQESNDYSAARAFDENNATLWRAAAWSCGMPAGRAAECTLLPRHREKACCVRRLS